MTVWSRPTASVPGGAAGAVLAIALPMAFLSAGAVSAEEACRGPEGQETTKTWAIAEFGTPLYDESMPHWPYVNPDAPKGGRVTLGAFGSFDSLNPIILKGDWPRSIGLISDSLMVGSGDELASAYGLIAESVEYPEDISWAVFTLRPEARFHDGHPITADDFVFGFEAVQEHGRPFLKSFYEPIGSVEALGEHCLKVTFKTRNSMKPLMFAAGLSPLPRHYWEARDISKTTLEPTLGSGAYRIKDVDAGRSITYERVPDYWAKDLNVSIGLDNFDRIRYDYYRDRTVEFEAFKAGNIDFFQENSSKRWATGYDLPAIKDGRLVKTTLPDNVPQGVQAFFFNLRRPKFQDIRVREAISLLYDFESIQKAFLYGYRTRTESYFPNSDFGAQGAPTEAELAFLEPYRDQLDPRILTEAFAPPVSDASGRIRQRMRDAVALLKEAGWSLKDGRMINDRTGEQMRIEFLLASPILENMTAAFVQNLKRIGISARIRIVDSSQYQRLIDEFDFDITTVRLNFFPPPGPELRSYYGSAAADVKGSANMAGIKNPVADALIEEIIAAESLETLKAASRALDRVLLWNHYVIPQYHSDEHWIVYWDKFDHPERMPKYATGFPSTWWIDPQRAAALASH